MADLIDHFHNSLPLHDARQDFFFHFLIQLALEIRLFSTLRVLQEAHESFALLTSYIHVNVCCLTSPYGAFAPDPVPLLKPDVSTSLRF